MVDPVTPSPVGAHSLALVAGPPLPENLQNRSPSLLPPEYIVPAKVVMVPAVETLRTTLLPVSEKYRFPELSTTMLVGPLSLAELAGPPSPLYPNWLFPATVVTVPFTTFRIRLFPV